jgi:glycerol-3-phosphate dehydrogenase subunit B
MTDDVLVVGGGLGGYVAALTAALEGPTASVRLLDLNTGRFRRETGRIDLLGYTPDGEGPVREPFAELSALPDDHPYSRVGVEGVRRALSLFGEVCRYSGLDSDANALVATATGHVTPTFLYPDSVAPGLVSDDRETLLVGFERLLDFDAELAAARLDDRLPYDVGSSSIRLPVERGDKHPVERFADALDDNEEVDGELPARRAVAGKTRNSLDIEPRIGFPAVLGRNDADDVRSDLEALLQADVFEIALGPPNLPGIRLRERLRSELDDAGVTVETGVTVDGFAHAGSRITELRVTVGDTGDRSDDAQRAYGAEQYVLATGGIGAGGLRGGRGRITERVLGCHVPQPSDRADWAAEGFLDDQPFARIGLDVDEWLRPQGSDGTPEFGNLRAAGRVLGGADVAAEQSTGGVAVATGHRAGQLAVER